MDNLFEFLVPIVVFIIWIVSGIFNKVQENKPARRESPRQQQAQSEQARRIREEIRKKIEQRKNESGQGEEQRRYDPTKPYGQQSHPAQQYREQKAPPLPPQYTQEPEYNDPWENESSSENTYDLDKLQEQIQNTRKRVEETEQAASALNAGDLTASNPYQYKEQDDFWENDITKAEKGRYRASLQTDIAAILKDPRGARKGFLYYEILGQPVGSRRNEQTGPFWK